VDTITISTPVSFWTQYSASRALVARMWNTYVAWAFFFGVPAATIIFMFATGRDITVPGLFGWPAWMLPLVGFAFMAVLMPLTTMFNIYSMRRRNPSRGSQTWVLSPDQFSVSGALFNTTLKWDAFFKARETRRFILLFVSSRSAHFIPKEAVRSPDDLSAIRSLIQHNLRSKAQLKNQT
jgi:YcxB-like protein